jgi:hypothetical protein
VLHDPVVNLLDKKHRSRVVITTEKKKKRKGGKLQRQQWRNSGVGKSECSGSGGQGREDVRM